MKCAFNSLNYVLISFIKGVFNYIKHICLIQIKQICVLLDPVILLLKIYI